MSVYILLLFIPVLFSPILNTKINNRDKAYIFCVYIVLWFFMAARGNLVGADTSMGKYIFNVEAALPWRKINMTYPGWSAMCKIIGMVDARYILFQALVSAIIVFSVARFVYVFSDDIVLSSYLYVCTYTYCTAFNVMRQMCAVALILQASVEMIKNRKKIALVIGLMACTIHFTAVVGLPILWVLSKAHEMDFQRLLKRVFVIGAFVVLLSDRLVNSLLLLVPHYSIYIGADSSTGGRTIMLQLIYLIVLVIGWKVYGHTDNSKFKSVILLSLISVCIGIFGAKNVFIMRVSAYFSIYVICMIPAVFRRVMRGKESKIIANVGIGLLLLIPYFIQLNGNYSGVVPYSFYK